MACQTVVSALLFSFIFVLFPCSEYLMCKTKLWQIELFLTSFSRFHVPLPVFCLFLFASKHLCFFTAGVALDKAAPLKFAVTLPHACILVCVVATAAAHEVAAIWVGWGVVAETAPGPCTTCQCILLAVVGRAFQINQVSVSGFNVAMWLFESQEGRLAQACGSYCLHLYSSTIPLF